MSRPTSEYADPPEGLDPEHAQAYRAGYERARRGAEPTRRLERDTPRVRERDVSAQPGRPEAKARPGRPGAAAREPWWSSRVAVTAVVLLSLALVLAAFGVGKVLSDDGSTSPAASPEAADAQQSRAERSTYQGPVTAVIPVTASATCQSPDSVDGAGNPMSYQPALAFDADLSTAWRCDGSGVGEELTLELAGGVRVAEVGLVPGYAKTDPASGADRYAENNRITRVRWRFADGSTYVQRLSPDPADRSLRTRRVPATWTGTVVLEVLASASGSRDTVAVSEVRIAAAG